MDQSIIEVLEAMDFAVECQPDAAPKNRTDFSLQCRHPKAGLLQIKQNILPHMQVMGLDWQTNQPCELYNPTISGTIELYFMLEGTVESRFKGLHDDVPLPARTHNLIHTPEPVHVNRLDGREDLAAMIIRLDRDFFASSIGADDAWSEQVTIDLERNRPFSGVPGRQTITPQMLCLIDDIRNCSVTGPMRNLLIQSRVLELVALEVDQFRKPIATQQLLPVDEAEKLHQLKAYLETHFLEDHSLAGLSRYCALNEFKVKKGFRQLFGTTVFNYLRQLRMEYAGELLRHHSLSIDEIADRLRYEHAQHFSIAFKKYTGLTPSQYQQGRPRPVANTPSLVAA